MSDNSFLSALKPLRYVDEISRDFRNPWRHLVRSGRSSSTTHSTRADHRLEKEWELQNVVIFSDQTAHRKSPQTMFFLNGPLMSSKCQYIFATCQRLPWSDASFCSKNRFSIPSRKLNFAAMVSAPADSNANNMTNAGKWPSVVVVPKPKAAPTPQRMVQPQQILTRFEVSIAEAQDAVVLEDYEIVLILDDSLSMNISSNPSEGRSRFAGGNDPVVGMSFENQYLCSSNWPVALIGLVWMSSF